MSKIMVSIARNIKKYRISLDMSQDKLSKLAGVALYTITKIESGTTLDPRIKTIKKISDVLGCSIDELIK